MDKTDIEKIEKIISDRQNSHNFYLKNSSVYQAFVAMEQKAFSAEHLAKKYKELIAIGISIINNCESCLEWHIKQAIDSGVSEEQIIEAIGVGIEMGGGPATVSSRFALKVLDYYHRQITIRELNSDHDLKVSEQLIRKSFLTVTNDFELTAENYPTNPAFISLEKLKALPEKGVKLFGLFENESQLGFVAIGKANDSLFYMEKLAVLPEYRHRGYGRKLIDFVFRYVKKENGTKVSIGIINEHTLLKRWYENYGFSATAVKKYEHLPFTVCLMEKNL